MPQVLANPPIAATKTPKLICPPGAVDSHFHLFGPAAQYSFHPDSPYRSADALPETIIAMHKVMGVSRGVIVNGGGYGRDPRHLMDTLKRFPTYFRGVAVPPDHLSDAEIDEMTALGVCGVRFVSLVRGTHLSPILPKLAAAVAERGWHVQFYGHGGDIVDNVERLLALPNDIVLDHFGAINAEKGLDQPAFKTVLKLLDTGRVWVKLSGPMRCSRLGPPYADMTPYAHALVAHAPERLVWGTDWPHVNMNDQVMPNDGDLLDMMLDWVPDEAVRNRILVDNACKRYGFDLPAAGAVQPG
jgi:predicted TIM-barrel fold metal-dependent hydrolase